MNKKILNFLLSIIVILIVIIFACAFYIFSQNRASSSIFDDIEAVTSNTVSQENIQTVTENFADKLEKLYPFTGAFPDVDVIPFIFETKPITNFSNEQILRLGFAKVTKDDWASTYISETEPVSIPASLLDKYIKDIFGENVQYTKTNFSNSGYTVDKDYVSPTSSYKATYVAESDTYVIDHVEGDGVNEDNICLLEPSISKIYDNIEIEVPYVFIKVADELLTREVNGGEESTYEYIIYTNYNYEDKTFSGEIGRFSGFDVNEDGTFVMLDNINKICNKHLPEIQKLQLIYQGNENQTEQILKEIR